MKRVNQASAQGKVESIDGTRPHKMASKFIEAFEQLAADPGREDLDTKPLTGRQGFRLRIGGWRAIYRIEKNRLVIYVLAIRKRGGVYK